MDYIYCITYDDESKINSQPPEDAVTVVECRLAQRQRSSQQILDLVDYLNMHSILTPIRRYVSESSFSSDIPLWIDLANPKSFFHYFEDEFKCTQCTVNPPNSKDKIKKCTQCTDVMLMWNTWNKPSNFNEIEDFCRDRGWRCTSRGNVRGSEATVTILYDFDDFAYESLTRAITQLVIVTIQSKQR